MSDFETKTEPIGRRRILGAGIATLGAGLLTRSRAGELTTGATGSDAPRPAQDAEANSAEATSHNASRDRQAVLAAGMTEAEADCWAATADAAAKFFALPELHPMDRQEVATAIHVLQNKLLGRPVYRVYRETAKRLHEEAGG
ncbi:hypothetical protein ABI59_16375 [Acidobacteria bacterium Mor1]|nr:hypothetical protein ABI59_16375 [Acidobacteria bacterium Mor1]